MNPFMLAGGALMLAASLWSLLVEGDELMSFVYLCFGAANGALAWK